MEAEWNVQGRKVGAAGGPSESCLRGWPCGCLLRLRPRRRNRSSSASARDRWMTRTSRGWPQPRCRRIASCSAGGRSSRPRARSTGPRGTGSSAGSPRTESGPSHSCGDRRTGWAAARGAPPLNSAADRAGVAGLPPKARWRATGPAAATGPNTYHQQYGASATPLPVKSWQIWNEPNLKKYFDPGRERQPVGPEVRRLLQISHDAITSLDPKAQIVLAGNARRTGTPRPGTSSTTSTRCPGSRSYFDAAALHPYARDLDELRREIQQFRALMTNHDDAATPLWLTELGWGSAPSGPIRHQRGPRGPRAAAVQLVQADPAPPQRLERPAPLLVPLARSGTGFRRTRAGAASAAARGS